MSKFGGGLGLAAMVIGLVPIVQADASTLDLAPSSKWQVEWRDKSCVLGRAFGTDNEAVILRFERFGPTDSFLLSMAGKPLGFLEDKPEELGSRIQPIVSATNARIRYGEGEPRRISFQMATTDTHLPAAFFRTHSLAPEAHTADEAPPVTAQMEAAATSVSLILPTRMIMLQTGPLDAPFAALRQCTDDLVKSWGFDPKQQSALRQHAKPVTTAGSWFTSDDFPATMLRAGSQALINFRLSVDATGKPTACEIQQSRNNAAFDKLSCTILMQRARFEPAIDAAGNPVASYYINTVRYVVG